MNLTKYAKRKREEELGTEVQNKKSLSKFDDSYYECNNSGILLIPSQINDFQQLNSSSDLFNHSEAHQNATAERNITDNNYEFCIFDETLSKNLLEGDIFNNSTPIPTIIGCDNNSFVNKTQKSPTKTSSSVTFLSKNVGIKKRKLIVPPIIYGRRLRNENNNKSMTNSTIPSKPKRMMKLRGDNYVKEFLVYRDEDYGKIYGIKQILDLTFNLNLIILGIIDNTDQLLQEGENVHRQDDDRQTTSEVQDWAIGLVKRYLGETVKLIRQESSRINDKQDRIRTLRQRFGFPTKVREV